MVGSGHPSSGSGSCGIGSGSGGIGRGSSGGIGIGSGGSGNCNWGASLSVYNIFIVFISSCILSLLLTLGLPRVLEITKQLWGGGGGYHPNDYYFLL